MSIAEINIQSAKKRQGRYRFYREHKYVSFVLGELERLIAKTDFTVSSQVARIQNELNEVVQLMCSHAEYEENKLHALLRAKGSAVFQKVEEDHKKHDDVFRKLQSLLDQIEAASDEAQQDELGYLFYLSYRKFVSENLEHINEEESKILPELQRLYSDEELRRVEAETYQRMTVEQMTHMVQVLFPHFNPSDQRAFLADIKEAAPEKFVAAFDGKVDINSVVEFV